MTRDEFRYRALLAEACLRLEAARQYGFVEGGPDVNIEVCESAIADARDAGVTYTPGEIDQFTAELAVELAQQ